MGKRHASVGGGATLQLDPYREVAMTYEATIQFEVEDENVDLVGRDE
jgi:hypothetical protein